MGGTRGTLGGSVGTTGLRLAVFIESGLRAPTPRIAKAADVPVLPAYFHYPERIIGFGPLFDLGEDLDSDMARIRAWYRPWQGKYHGTP